jgi:hypothetical protein
MPCFFAASRFSAVVSTAEQNPLNKARALVFHSTKRVAYSNVKSNSWTKDTTDGQGGTFVGNPVVCPCAASAGVRAAERARLPSSCNVGNPEVAWDSNGAWDAVADGGAGAVPAIDMRR